MNKLIIAISLCALLAMLAGLGMIVSPFFIEGGIIGWFEAVEAENWIGSAATAVVSFAFGVFLFFWGGIAAIVVATSTAAVRLRKSATDGRGPFPDAPPEDHC